MRTTGFNFLSRIMAIVPYKNWARETIQEFRQKEEYEKFLFAKHWQGFSITRGVGGTRNPTAGAFANQFKPISKEKQDFLNAVDMVYAEYGMRCNKAFFN